MGGTRFSSAQNVTWLSAGRPKNCGLWSWAGPTAHGAHRSKGKHPRKGSLPWAWAGSGESLGRKSTSAKYAMNMKRCFGVGPNIWGTGYDRTRILFCAMTSVGPTSCASNNTGSDDLQIASSKQNEVRSPRNESASATWSYLRWIPSILVPPSFENRLSGPASPEDMPLALGDNVIQHPGTVKIQGKLVLKKT